MSVSQLVPAFCSTVLAMGAATIDLRERRIPNVLTLSGAGIGIFYNLFWGGWVNTVSGLTGMAIGVVCLLPAYLRRGMGAGDVKLLGAIGAWVGTMQILRVIFYMACIGGVFALVKLMLIRTQDVHSPSLSTAIAAKDLASAANILTGSNVSIPYGPAIAGGALLNLLVSLL